MIMADIVQTLATQTGIPADTVQKAIGSLLAFFKEHHGEAIFGTLTKALPGHSKMLDAFNESQSAAEPGNLLSSVAGLASKFLGGSVGEGTKLIEGLGRSGLSLDQIGTFLPKLIEQFESQLPPEVFSKVKDLLAGVSGSSTKPS